jgi:hypothetical protein
MAITISFSQQQKEDLTRKGVFTGLGTRVFNHDGAEIKDIVSLSLKIEADKPVYATIVVALDISQEDIILGGSSIDDIGLPLIDKK